MFKSRRVRAVPKMVFPHSRRGSSVENVIVYESEIGGYVTFTHRLSTHKAPQIAANHIFILTQVSPLTPALIHGRYSDCAQHRTTMGNKERDLLSNPPTYITQRGKKKELSVTCLLTLLIPDGWTREWRSLQHRGQEGKICASEFYMLEATVLSRVWGSEERRRPAHVDGAGQLTEP